MPPFQPDRDSRISSASPGTSMDSSPIQGLIASSPEHNRRWFDGLNPVRNEVFHPRSPLTLTRRSTRSHITIDNGDHYVRRGPADAPSEDSSVRTKTSIFTEVDEINPIMRPLAQAKKLLQRDGKNELSEYYKKSHACFGLSCGAVQSNILFSDWKKAKIRSLSKRIYIAHEMHKRHIIIEKLKEKLRHAYEILKDKSLNIQEDHGVSHDALSWERQQLENIEHTLHKMSAKTHRGINRMKRWNYSLVHMLCGRTQKKASRFAWNDLDAEDRSFVKSVIIDVGFCLSLYNIPAYRLEETLIFLAATYGLDIDLQVTPTSFLISFHDFLIDQKIEQSVDANTTDLAHLEQRLLGLIEAIEKQTSDNTNVSSNLTNKNAGSEEKTGPNEVSGGMVFSVKISNDPKSHSTVVSTVTGTENTPTSKASTSSQMSFHHENIQNATRELKESLARIPDAPMSMSKNPLSSWNQLPCSPAKAPIVDENGLRQRRRSNSLPPLAQNGPRVNTPTYSSVSMQPDPYTFGMAADSPHTNDIMMEDARISPMTESVYSRHGKHHSSISPISSDSLRLHINSPVAEEHLSHRSKEPVLRTSNNEDRAATPNPVEQIAKEEDEEKQKRLLPSEMYLLGNTTHFVSIPSQSLNLTKIILLERLAEYLQESNIELKDAHGEMRKILSFRPLSDAYPFQFVASLMSTTSFAVFLDANRIEILATFVASLLIVLADSALSFTPSLKRMYISIAAMIGGGVALLFKQMFVDTEYPVNTFLVALASIVMFLPGLGITVAFAELSERKIQSGILRLMESVVNIFRLSIGILITDSLERIFFPDDYGNVQPEYSNPSWAYALACVGASFGFGIAFRAPFYFTSWLFTFVASFAAFFSSQYLRPEVGKELSTVLGAVILGIFSQLYARFTGHPALIISSVAILLLVPGSLMLRSIQTQFVGNDTSAAMAFIFETGITAIALTIGLSISKILVPSNRTLNLI